MLSTVALAARGHAEAGSVVAPTNAISHWFWGDRAARQDAPSARYTLLGYVTHHIASIFWAVFYERWFGRSAERGDVSTAVAGGIAVAAVACFVDYRMTPRRFEPGYEKRIGKPSLALVYLCFGAGLAIGSLVNARLRAEARLR
jgi:hypothetical protein